MILLSAEMSNYIALPTPGDTSSHNNHVATATEITAIVDYSITTIAILIVLSLWIVKPNEQNKKVKVISLSFAVVGILLSIATILVSALTSDSSCDTTALNVVNYLLAASVIIMITLLTICNTIKRVVKMSIGGVLSSVTTTTVLVSAPSCQEDEQDFVFVAMIIFPLATGVQLLTTLIVVLCEKYNKNIYDWVMFTIFFIDLGLTATAFVFISVSMKYDGIGVIFLNYAAVVGLLVESYSEIVEYSISKGE